MQWRNVSKKIACVLSILLACGIVAMLYLDHLDQKRTEAYLMELAEQQKQEKKELIAEQQIKLLSSQNATPHENIKNIQVLLTPEQFVEGRTEISNTVDMMLCQGYQVEASNMALYFEATASKSAVVTVQTYDLRDNRSAPIEIYLNAQKTGYYIPLSLQNSFSKVTYKVTSFDGEEEIAISNMQLLTSGSEPFPAHLHGNYIMDDSCKETQLSAPVLEMSNAVDSALNGDLLYIGSLDRVDVIRIGKKQKLTTVASVTGLGTVRRVLLSEDGNTLVVACREYGVYLIDVQEPKEPTIIGHIDTLELASGLDICGNYLFIASRYYGIEVYDISNPSSPAFISCMKSPEPSERIDCTVHNGYLYAGVWGTQRIEVFDVRNIHHPQYVGYVSTDGNTYGLKVSGNILVASTGFHSTKNSALDPTEFGYGTGNGISLFSIEDPENPKEITTIRADGRYYEIGKDYWNVMVIDNLVYFADLYSGLYVYDIENPESPKEIEHITLSVEKDSSDYRDFDDEFSVFPYNKTQKMQAPITSVSVGNGVLYITDELKGVHVVEAPYAKMAEKSAAFDFAEDGQFSYSEPTENGVEVISVGHGQAFAVAEHGAKYYVGTSDGIVVLDKNFKEVNFVPTRCAVRDLKIVGNKIFTAESVDGISVYQIGEKDIVKLGSGAISEPNRASVCNQIGVSPDGKHAVATGRLNLFVLLDVSDPTNIQVVEYLKSGAAYYRNVCQGVNMDKNAIYLTTAAGISELLFHKDGTYEYNQIDDPSFYTSTGGFTYVEDNQILAITQNGYRLLDISNGIDLTTASEKVEIYKLPLKGVPYYHDGTLVVSYALTGRITVINIEKPETPELLQDFSVQSAVDGPFIASDGTMIVPARYEGLVVIRE